MLIFAISLLLAVFLWFVLNLVNRKGGKLGIIAINSILGIVGVIGLVGWLIINFPVVRHIILGLIIFGIISHLIKKKY